MATDIAAVLIDIITLTQSLSEGGNVSDCRPKVNCAAGTDRKTGMHFDTTRAKQAICGP
jgi:hypothetical protein